MSHATRWGGNSPPEVWVPSASSQFLGAGRGPYESRRWRFPQPPNLRPQGFAPSRRVAPQRISRTYFIPIPLLGFDPPRSYSCAHAGGPLGLRDPRDLLRATFQSCAVPPGLCSWAQSRPPRKVIHPRCCDYLPGLLLLRGLLPRSVHAACCRSRLTTCARRAVTPLMHFPSPPSR